MGKEGDHSTSDEQKKEEFRIRDDAGEQRQDFLFWYFLFSISSILVNNSSAELIVQTMFINDFINNMSNQLNSI